MSELNPQTLEALKGDRKVTIWLKMYVSELEDMLAATADQAAHPGSNAFEVIKSGAQITKKKLLDGLQPYGFQESDLTELIHHLAPVMKLGLPHSQAWTFNIEDIENQRLEWPVTEVTQRLDEIKNMSLSSPAIALREDYSDLNERAESVAPLRAILKRYQTYLKMLYTPTGIGSAVNKLLSIATLPDSTEARKQAFYQASDYDRLLALTIDEAQAVYENVFAEVPDREVVRQMILGSIKDQLNASS
jgi:hypothetical protein